MADVLCMQCGEPYEAFGPFGADMLKWEAELFLKGAGCPCCEGDGDFITNAMSAAGYAVVHTPDRAERMLYMASGEYTPPEWKEPPNELIEACDLCSLELHEDADDGELIWHNWGTKPDNVRPSKEYFRPWCSFASVCHDCQIECVACRAPLVNDREVDCYDGGAIYREDDYTGRSPLCVDCYVQETNNDDS